MNRYIIFGQMKLICELRARSWEQGKRERGVGIVVRNPKIKTFTNVNFKNSNFNKNYDLLPWIQKSLLPSEIEESTYEKEGEQKIKLEKKRVRGIERETKNF